MTEKRYRWPEIQKKWADHCRYDAGSRLGGAGPGAVAAEMFRELLGLPEQPYSWNEVEDLIDRMKAALAEQDAIEEEERAGGRYASFSPPPGAPCEPNSVTRGDAEKAAMAEKVLAYHPLQEQFRKPLAEILKDAEKISAEAMKECPCGGPPGHVPGGVWCRK